MRIYTRHRGQSGFSLIEVLIAVIVLATGLLALAALQINLTSSSADAKARSRIAGLLTSAIDHQRTSGYACVADSISACTATACTLTAASCDSTTIAAMKTSLQGLISTAQTEGGVSGLGLAQTATTVGNYKNIALSATWTDATGGSRSLGVNTIASSLALSASSTLLSQSLSGSGGTSPVIHETNPGSTAGVIPIAVGANTNAAATNPTPNINKYTLPSTTFNVLTYSQGSNDTSLTSTIQKRVETTIAECVCSSSSTNPIASVFLNRSTFRPTYWNGIQYVAPTIAAGITPYSTSNSSVTQDSLCVQCCRDHHDVDQAGTAATAPFFDSVTGDTNRYQVTHSGTTITTPISLRKTGSPLVPVAATMSGAADGTNFYLDSCRLIRVDGLWRVASDLSAEHTGLIATSPQGVGTTSVPSTTSAAAYEDFVIDYLGQKLTNILSSGSAPVANSVFASHGLDNPTLIDITGLAGDYRYLHGRGLYLDHLEASAIAKLTAVNSTCAAANFPTCLLPYLPFNTVNVTELATFASSATGTLTVTNSSTACVAGAPIRGCVKGIVAGTANAGITMGHSNSALASSIAINPYELLAANQQTDSQAFRVTSTNTASEFFVSMTGLPQTSDLSTSDDPSVTWTVGVDSDYCFSNISRTDSDPNPYDCVTTVLLALPFSVTLGSYNVVTNQDIANPCAGGTGTWSQPMLTCNTISASSVTGVGGSGYNTSTAVSGTKTAGERTVITIAIKNAGSITPMTKSAGTLGLTFIANGSAVGTYTCDVLTNNPTFTTPTNCP